MMHEPGSKTFSIPGHRRKRWSEEKNTATDTYITYKMIKN